VRTMSGELLDGVAIAGTSNFASPSVLSLSSDVQAPQTTKVTMTSRGAKTPAGVELPRSVCLSSMALVQVQVVLVLVVVTAFTGVLAQGVPPLGGPSPGFLSHPAMKSHLTKDPVRWTAREVWQACIGFQSGARPSAQLPGSSCCSGCGSFLRARTASPACPLPQWEQLRGNRGLV
jgi:hypothetical protein